MKRILPYTFALAILSVVSNVLLIVDFIYKHYAKEADFTTAVMVMFFISFLLFMFTSSIYNYNLTRGEQSVRKLARTIVLLSWVDLLFVSFALIEGIHAEQNPFTNSTVLISWALISILVTAVYFCEKRFGNLYKS
ncbi:hypothetical protein PAECIP111892_03204 [Paenibacillus auburnensis]|uniref:Uncharacterized protein n=1 Tax=Paenibacillus auburnensis TaxID=2905649 RepID=A0ABN8GHE3_9BACL|nr:hypothetical protein [Paenibacillus auburnensis]CAH1209373.1 hypothetical protein PAECIP111892_03204 [Paenibacillus auburnensis]